MIPMWLWTALAIVCLVALAEYDCWRINRRRDNDRAIDVERIARENATPLGNVERLG